MLQMHYQSKGHSWFCQVFKRGFQFEIESPKKKKEKSQLMDGHSNLQLAVSVNLIASKQNTCSCCESQVSQKHQLGFIFTHLSQNQFRLNEHVFSNQIENALTHPSSLLLASVQKVLSSYFQQYTTIYLGFNPHPKTRILISLQENQHEKKTHLSNNFSFKKTIVTL